MEDKYIVLLTHYYKAKPSEVFKRISDGTLFKLTSAEGITFDFKEGGAFKLIFKDRGEIYGTFGKIIPNKRVNMLWNVEGFNRPSERNTQLSISLLEKNGAIATIEHRDIQFKEAAEAKEKAWEEILKDMERELSSKVRF